MRNGGKRGEQKTSKINKKIKDELRTSARVMRAAH